MSAPSAEVVPLPYSTGEAEQAIGPGSGDLVRRAYRWMLLARTLDARMLALQRQGRIGFYGPATGQEAVSIGAALALEPSDWVFPGLREQLVALVRAHPLPTYVHHLFADREDPSKGRQMPCHPTARDARYVSMSSVVGTQIIHAVGTAYAQRLKKDRGVSVAFFGDGATSANDFHSGLNFAAVYRLPVVFLLTNNQWAISMPVGRQTHVSRLADKALAYGLPGDRVDGTDFVAVFQSVRDRLAAARAGEGPSLLELVVYRMTAHSSSDDPTRYQPAEWAREALAHDPVLRLGGWLRDHHLLDPSEEERWKAEVEAEVKSAIQAAEASSPPDEATLTADVFAPAGSPSPGA